MYSNLAVNKYPHTFASRWISSTLNHDARNHEYKKEYVYIYIYIYIIAQSKTTFYKVRYEKRTHHAHSISVQIHHSLIQRPHNEILLHFRKKVANPTQLHPVTQISLLLHTKDEPFTPVKGKPHDIASVNLDKTVLH